MRRTLIRVGAVATSIALVVLAARFGISEASRAPAATDPTSILPTNVGIGVASHDVLLLDFDQPMDIGSVQSTLLVQPATNVRLSWSADARHLRVAPATRWQTDARYLLVAPATARLANGSVLGAAVQWAFTTQTAPTVTEFGVARVGLDDAAERLSLLPATPDQPGAQVSDTADTTSASTSVTISFSAAMDRAQVESSFHITPEVQGAFDWEGTTLVFTPVQRLDPNVRYAVSLLGAHDLQGNPLDGDLSFSFTTASAARIVKVAPSDGSRNVTARSVGIWFDRPVDVATTGDGFSLYDLSAKAVVKGTTRWTADGTQLTFTASAPLKAGHRMEIRIGQGATDADGNSLRGTFAFTTKAPPTTTVRSVPRTTAMPAPSGSAQAYALSLINASRRAYGFAPLRLDAALTAVASAHAWDQIRYNYFSHVSRDGSTYRDRLAAAGISFTHAGENQCLDYGTITHAISWCHSIMMAEPYPGYWNHIANILNPNFTRVGFGYGRASDGKLIMTWDFAG